MRTKKNNRFIFQNASKKLKTGFNNTLMFFKEQKNLTKNEKIFKPSMHPKLLFLSILLPVNIFMIVDMVENPTFDNLIFYVFTNMFFFLLVGIDVFGKHILIKEKVILQRDYFFRVEQLDIASIKKCLIILGTLVRFVTDKKYMNIKTFYYSESDIRAIAKLVGHPLADKKLTFSISDLTGNPKLRNSSLLKKIIYLIYFTFEILLPILVAVGLSMWVVFGIFIEIVKKYPEPLLTIFHFLAQFIGEETSRYIVSFTVIIPVIYVMKKTFGFILNIIYKTMKSFRKFKKIYRYRQLQPNSGGKKVK